MTRRAPTSGTRSRAARRSTWALAAILALAGLGAGRPARAASSIDELRLTLTARFDTYLGPSDTFLATQEARVALQAALFDPDFVKLGLTLWVAGGEGAGSVKTLSLYYGYDGLVQIKRRSKVSGTLFTSRLAFDSSQGEAMDYGSVTTVVGGSVYLRFPRAPRLMLRYEHVIQTFDREPFEPSTPTERNELVTDRFHGWADYKTGESLLALDTQLWSQHDASAASRFTLLLLQLRDETWLSPRLRLGLRAQQTRISIDYDAASAAPVGPTTQYQASADLRYTGRRWQETAQYDYLYTATDQVKHSASALSSETVWVYRPNLRFRGGFSFGRDEVLARDAAEDLGATRAVWTAGAVASARNPFMAWNAEYNLGLGGTWVDGDGGGFLHSHRARVGMQSAGLKRVSLALLGDYNYTSDGSPLGDTTESYGLMASAQTAFKERLSLQARLQVRHFDGLDALRLRGRIDQTAVTGGVNLDVRLTEWAAANASVYGNYFAESNLGFSSSVGGFAGANLSTPTGAATLSSLLQWETQWLQEGARTQWVRGELRASYRTGASRFELLYYLWNYSQTTTHYLIATYSRWFDFVDTRRSSRSR